MNLRLAVYFLAMALVAISCHRQEYSPVGENVIRMTVSLDKAALVDESGTQKLRVPAATTVDYSSTPAPREWPTVSATPSTGDSKKSPE